MIKRTFCAAAAALLLTGCAVEPLVNTTSEPDLPAVTVTTAAAAETTVTAETSQTAQTVLTSEISSVTTVSETQPAEAPVQFVVVPATAATFAPAVTQTTASTAPAKPDYQLRFGFPLDLETLFYFEENADLPGTGYVYAKDGVFLRSEPSVSSKQLATIKYGSTVEILGVSNIDSQCPNPFKKNSWFRIKADGKEGYATAEYIAAKFTIEPSQLSKRQLRALSACLYSQGQMLFRQFAYEGGLHAGGTNSASKISASQKSYAQVQPSSLKLSDIYTEFYEYFSPNNNKDLLTAASADKIPYYIEKNGKLYARVPDSSRSKLADRYTYDFAGSVKDMTDTEITISSGWEKDEHSIPEGDTFTLVYEDGVWKIGKFSYHY